jgi:hypothetical protein
MIKHIIVSIFLIGVLICFVYFNNPEIMKENNPVWTFEGSSDLPISEMESMLFSIKEGNFKARSLPFITNSNLNYTVRQDNLRYILTFTDGHEEYVSIDKVNNILTIQGQWWYRGVYKLIPQRNKTLIRLEVYNVAKKNRWIASLMILPDKNKHKEAFERFVKKLENAMK